MSASRAWPSSVVDEWCPLANFFLHADAARAWAAADNVEGRVLTLDEASACGTARLAQLLRELRLLASGR